MKAKILVVDDEVDVQDLIAQRFELEIEEGEYEFFFAENGVEALSKIREQSELDLVLTDINMPLMDGIALLGEVKALNPLIKTIVVSAYGDMENIRKAMNRGAFDFVTKPISFRDLEITIERTLKEVQESKETQWKWKQAQMQLVQSEKMSALGQLVAGIAHEINNPVNFIYGNLSFAENYTQDLLDFINWILEQSPSPDPQIRDQLDNIDFDFLKEDLPKLLTSMKVGADRIRSIVLSLRNFSRVDQRQEEIADLHLGLDDTLLILQNRLKAQSYRPAIQIIKDYGDLPKIKCYLGQMNQVFMNILSNAIDAIDDTFLNPQPSLPQTAKQIRISTRYENNWAIFRIADDGPGMPETVRNQLFNPFFTTKPVGKGTGLGLSISYQIIAEKHGGRIYCNSIPGQGTEFVIEIPNAVAPAQTLPVSEPKMEVKDLVAC